MLTFIQMEEKLNQAVQDSLQLLAACWETVIPLAI